MAKYQTWHVWNEYKNHPDDAFVEWIKVEVEAPTETDACRDAAQQFWDNNNYAPLSAIAYDVGFGRGPRPQKFKSKVVYEVDRELPIAGVGATTGGKDVFSALVGTLDMGKKPQNG